MRYGSHILTNVILKSMPVTPQAMANFIVPVLVSVVEKDGTSPQLSTALEIKDVVSLAPPDNTAGVLQ